MKEITLCAILDNLEKAIEFVGSDDMQINIAIEEIFINISNYENAHPAIVDLQQFSAVQQLLNESGEKFKKLGNKLDDNILVGKIFCSRCGKALKRQYYYKSKKHKNEIKYRYYCLDCCSELRHLMGLEKTPHFPFEEIEGAITILLQKHMDACITIDTLIEDVINSGGIQTAKRIKG